MMKNIEILAPCGSKASFEAAINAGADAVYLAGNRFGARAYAENFSDEDLCRAIEKAHLKGVKVYLTVNTLFKNAEIMALPEYLRPFYEVGLDAVIVQDLGAFSLIREAFPDMPIHASTQMNICSAEGAEFIKRLGASRVIPARELTLDEIRSIKEKVDTEVEVFVHGAMCYCYSGRCLFSSMAGDRSGNRGRCAQPCRRRYNDSFLMSMKDMCALPYVPQLIEAGVDSLKIEGRMKGDYYTAAVVDAYRQMADDALAGHFSMKKAEKYIEKLSETFSRGGFCEGYFDKAELPYMIDSSAPGHKGVLVGNVVSAGHGKVTIDVLKHIGIRDVLTIDMGRQEGIEITSNLETDPGKSAVFNTAGSARIKNGAKVYRKINKNILDDIKSSLIDREKLMPASVYFKVRHGEPLMIRLSSGVYKTECFGNVVMPAEKKAVTNEAIEDKLRGFGELGYRIDNLEIDNDNESFISFGEIKSLRREAAARLDEMILDSYKRTCDGINLKNKYDTESVRDNGEYISKPEIMENHIFESVEPANNNSATLVKISNKNSTESSKTANNHITESSKTANANVKHVVYISVENDIAANSLKKLFESGILLSDNAVQYIFGFTVDMFTENMLCELKRYFSKFGSICAELPFIHREEDEKYFTDRYAEILDDEDCDHIFIRNIDDLSALLIRDDLRKKCRTKTLILAHSVYAYNNRAIAFIYSLISDNFKNVIFEASHELTLSEQKELLFPDDSMRMLTVYGKEELMLTAQMPDAKSKGFLKDERSGAYRYFKSRDLCYNALVDEKPFMLDKTKSGILPMDIIRISLYDESDERAYNLLEYYTGRDKGDSFIKINKSDGHFTRPIL